MFFDLGERKGAGLRVLSREYSAWRKRAGRSRWGIAEGLANSEKVQVFPPVPNNHTQKDWTLGIEPACPARGKGGPLEP